METQTIRVGVVGCGGISKVHIAALKTLPDVKIQAVCDIRPARAAQTAEDTGADAMADWRKLIRRDDIDAVHICLPHDLHAPVALDALKQGKHVLTEKPLATSLQDALAMIRAAEAPGAKTLGVIFQNRYNPSVRQLKAALEAGQAGAILGARASVTWHRAAPYYAESGWRGTWAHEGGGALINQSIHTLDLLGYLLGPIARVRGHVSTDLLDGVIEVEDNAHAVFAYRGGQRGVLHATTSYVADAPIILEVQGEKCAYRLEGDRLYRVKDGALTELFSGEAPMLEEKAYWGASHLTEIAAFYRSIRTGTRFAIGPREALPALNLVLAIYESSRSGQWVELLDAETV